MPVHVDKWTPAGAVHESWRAFLASDRELLETMPVIEQLHTAHVIGFIGGLIYAGMSEDAARAIADVEFRRRDREGDPT